MGAGPVRRPLSSFWQETIGIWTGELVTQKERMVPVWEAAAHSTWPGTGCGRHGKEEECQGHLGVWLSQRNRESPRMSHEHGVCVSLAHCSVPDAWHLVGAQ